MGAMGDGLGGAFRTLAPADVDRFGDVPEPNVVKMLWHFGVEPAGLARSILTIETRLRCAGSGGTRSACCCDGTHSNRCERARAGKCFLR